MSLTQNPRVWSSNFSDNTTPSPVEGLSPLPLPLKYYPDKDRGNLPLYVPSQRPPTTLVPREKDSRMYDIENVDPVSRRTPLPQPPPPEEVCIECAMRDEEMADVDVTSHNVWDRESDVWYDELVNKERDDEIRGIAPAPGQTRATGDLLTEANIKVWLTMNPKEPTTRERTVREYSRAQIQLLAAEAVARDQAAHESRVLSYKMRETYSALRRSAYELQASPSMSGEEGVRIKPPRSASGSGFVDLTGSSSPERGRSIRESTLLGNGMIVERVDLKKEEKEKKKRERSRKRASSQVSGRESIPYAPSTHSLVSSRPMSVATSAPGVPQLGLRPQLPRLHSTSQSSFEGSTDRSSKSPRFFGFKNWSSMGSRSSLALSGSMMDMHVALDHDRYNPNHVIFQSPGSIPVELLSNEPHQTSPEEWRSVVSPAPTTSMKSVKKKTGLGKLWKIITGSSKDRSAHDPSQVQPMVPQMSEKPVSRSPDHDDYSSPLIPPPPLSMLVDRSRTPPNPAPHMRGAPSSMSLSSSSSPRNGRGISPPTTSSSLLSSPTSTKFREGMPEDNRKSTLLDLDAEFRSSPFMMEDRPLHRVASDTDMRRSMILPGVAVTSAIAIPSSPVSTNTVLPGSREQANSFISRPKSILRADKTLPPIPNGNFSRPLPLHSKSDGMPRATTLYEPFPETSQLPFPYSSPQPKYPGSFLRGLDISESRRQSFGGTSSRPNLASLGPQPHTTLGIRPTEFSASRMSLGFLEDTRPSRAQSTVHPSEPSTVRHRPRDVTTPSTKRRSRFGLSSLLGRKNHETIEPRRPLPFAEPSYIVDIQSAGEFGAQLERQLSISSAAPRMSTNSRKPLGQLVDQEDELVAYRYPSRDDHLDLLRN
ncbi:hypothetical protein SISNIDRAFT_448559 [Sistotremastrum niveocremeum HHB9708]|uniref:Uncharacterized protein n=1 Tax=Sistotremastrum niveocremeum HHB9708 TaxID=1314777 RepID=A0A165A150_9AGAM|nr:hypothetical protein SISNIDRAFT_448559 [Sistotremastrum niveocremeum HHB9708]